MDENTNPQGATPLETALRQIQTWFVNGDFEKVKQGCKEVLAIAPNNSIAQDLLARADAEQRGASVPPAPLSPAPAPVPTPEPTPPPFVPSTPAEPKTPAPPPEPLHDEPPMPELITEPSNPLAPVAEDHDEIHHPHSLALNIGILVGIVILGIGGVYGYNTFFKGGDETPTPTQETQEENAEENVEEPQINEPTIEEPEVSEPPVPTPDLTTLGVEGRNQKRSEDLSLLEQALILYYDEFKKYPAAEEVNTVLVESGVLAEVPLPPGETEAYFYAVYGNMVGPDQLFILSAEFETDNGPKTVWSTGANVSEHPDYRSLEAPHVTIIHPTMTEAEYVPSQEPTTGRVPRVPRN